MSPTEQILKKHKLRITPIRKEVINLFTDSGHALSSADIEAQMPDADRITLYRTLKSFEEKGIIHKAIDGTATQKYALCEAQCDEHIHHDEHVHFHCENCELTFCMEGVFVPKVQIPAGFNVTQTDMVVKGVCNKCLAK
ncbi:MAG: transcriptional repressor [Saprospiraceae bacterium]|nr:MAG: ferric uptake regulator family protein [Bacteroidetes bacterium OLB9]MCO6462767.1 transcriptional repressor [Saprospiraceae bacterium]MCZ2339697.1 transcriptional repressor [Chitinophagales bacterium]